MRWENVGGVFWEVSDEVVVDWEVSRGKVRNHPQNSVVSLIIPSQAESNWAVIEDMMKGLSFSAQLARTGEILPAREVRIVWEGILAGIQGELQLL